MQKALTPFDLDSLRLELSVKAKNGLNFILASILIWSLIAYLWASDYSPSQKGLFTLMAGGLFLPLAWVFSKLLRTAWTVEGNPIEPLGLWLNFAQLAYFPILFYVYVRHMDLFVMVYVIITAAHFFPYAWFYNVKAFAVMAIFISVGAVWIRMKIPAQEVYLIPAFMAASLVVLAVLLGVSYRKNKARYHSFPNPVP